MPYYIYSINELDMVGMPFIIVCSIRIVLGLRKLKIAAKFLQFKLTERHVR